MTQDYVDIPIPPHKPTFQAVLKALRASRPVQYRPLHTKVNPDQLVQPLLEPRPGMLPDSIASTLRIGPSVWLRRPHPTNVLLVIGADTSRYHPNYRSPNRGRPTPYYSGRHVPLAVVVLAKPMETNCHA